MKVCGFTFIRNAIKYDYPIKEAILSILPLCDEVIVAVGNSEDGTRSLIQNIDPEKIKIIDTVWNDNLRSGGQVLAIETNKAFQAIPQTYDWAFYIQGDEVIHEKYHDVIYQDMNRWKDHPRVDGLLFNYLHFYGNYDLIGQSTNWYRKEIRVIKNNKQIYSYKDAQGFRKEKNKKLRVKETKACVHHYGWVKNPKVMQSKQKNFNKYWHNDEWVQQKVGEKELFDYSEVDVLKRFEGSHPEVMKARIKQKNWNFDYDLSQNNHSFKDKIRLGIEKLTDWRPGEYKNYVIV